MDGRDSRRSSSVERTHSEKDEVAAGSTPEVKNLNATHSYEEGGTNAMREEGVDGTEDRRATIESPPPVNLATPELVDLQRALVDVGLMTTNQWSEAVSTVGKSADLKEFLAYLTKIDSTRPLPTEESTPVLTKFQAQTLLDGNARKLWFQHYLILDRLGKGGMGEVLKALNCNLYRIEAVKMIKPQANTGPLETSARRRFKREAEILAALDHPYITKVWNAGFQDDLAYIAMEYVRGKDMEAIVREHRGRNEPIDVKWAIQVIIHVAEALEHAHERRVLHRDIKPSNIMITDDRIGLKVLDLGIGRLLSDESNSDHATLTQQGGPLGTPAFMPPEQWYDATSVTEASDIYSLGITLFYIVAGQLPFKGRNVMFQHLNDAPPRLRKFRPDAPKQLEAIIKKMLAKEPEQRYQSAKELIGALKPLIETKSVPELPWKQIGTGIVAACLVLGVGGGGIYLTPIIYRSLFTSELQKQLEALNGRIEASSPPKIEDLVQRASVFEQMDQFDKAVDDYKYALQLKTDPEQETQINFACGLAYLALEREQEALQRFKEVVSEGRQPGHPAANLQIAKLSLKNAEYERAARAATVALENSADATQRKEASDYGTAAYEKWISKFIEDGDDAQAIAKFEEANQYSLASNVGPLVEQVAQAYLREGRRLREANDLPASLQAIDASAKLVATPQAFLEAGEILLQQDGKVSEATQRLNRAFTLAADQNQSEQVIRALKLRAQAYRKQELFADEIADLTQLCEKWDRGNASQYIEELAAANLAYGNQLVEQDKFAEAVTPLEEYFKLQKEPSSEAKATLVDAYLQVAQQAREGSSSKAAIKALQRARQLDPRNGQATDMLAQTQAELAEELGTASPPDFDEAIRLLTESLALKQDPERTSKLASAYQQRADLRSGKQDFEAALADIVQARKLNDSEDFQQKQAAILVAWSETLAKPAEKIAKLQEALGLDPKPKIQIALGDAYRAARDFTKAETLYTAAQKNVPPEQRQELDHRLAAVFADQGMEAFANEEFQTAAEKLDLAIMRNPNLGPAYTAKAAESWVKHAGQVDSLAKKAELYDKARILETDKKAQYTSETALLRLQLGKQLAESSPQEALVELGKAKSLNPKLGEVSFVRGKLLLNNEPKEAAKEFDQAIANGYADAEVYWRRALAHEALGNKQLMVVDIIQAAKLAPNNQEYVKRSQQEKDRAIAEGNPYTNDPKELLAGALAATKEKKWPLAASWFDALLSVQKEITDPAVRKDMANAFAMHARSLAEQKDWDKAIGRYEQACALDPTDPLLSLEHGKLLVDQGKVSKAVQVYEGGLQQQPASKELQKALGTVLIKNVAPDQEAEPKLAEATYTQALTYLPENAEALLGRASSRVALKKFAEARDDCLKARQLDASLAPKIDAIQSQIAHERALLALTEKNPDAAIPFLQEALSFKPENTAELTSKLAQAYALQSQQWKEKDNLDKAIDSLRLASDTAPNEPAYRTQLLNLYEERSKALIAAGKHEQALADLTKLIQNASSDQRSNFLLVRGTVYQNLGQTDEALKDFDEAGQDPAVKSTANDAAAKLYREQGEKSQSPEQARKRFEQAYERYSNPDAKKEVGAKLAANLVKLSDSTEGVEEKATLLKQAGEYDPANEKRYSTRAGKLFKDAALESANKRTIEGYQEAIDYLIRAKDCLPEEKNMLNEMIAEHHYYKGVSLVRNREHQAAVEEYSNALSYSEYLKKADEAKYYLARANSKLSLQKYEEARADYATAVELDDSIFAAHEYLGLTLINYLPDDKKDISEGVKSLKKAADLAPKDIQLTSLQRLVSLLCTGKKAYRNGEDAVKYAKMLVERTKDLPDSQRAQYIVLLASAHAEAGQKDEAVSRMDEALELAPSDGSRTLRDHYAQGNAPPEPR